MDHSRHVGKRDNFKAKVRTLLAWGVAYRCSSPVCGKLTICANKAGDGKINIGRAAHITAAAANGPRFDKSLSQAERMHQDNGIWLCANCASLIDSDDPQFPVVLLQDWKKKAERYARDSVAQSNGRDVTSEIPVELDEEGEHQLAALELPAQDTLDSVAARLNSAARQDLEAFRRRPRWPLHTVDLNLHTKSEATNITLTIQGLANLLGVVRTLSIISAPGTGKTTTLTSLQLP